MKTLNSIILFTTFLMISTIGNSQYFGVKTGFNLSTVNYEMESDFDEEITYSTGYHFGLMLESKAVRGVSIEADLLYSIKGFKSKMEFSDYYGEYSYTSDLRLEYLEIPIFLKASGISDKIRYYAAAGPYLAIGRRGIATSNYSENDENYTDHYYVEMGNDEYDVLKLFDYGFSGSIGLEVKGILLTVSYAHGLQNTLNQGGPDDFIKNRTFSFSTGYCIDGGQAKEIIKVLNL